MRSIEAALSYWAHIDSGRDHIYPATDESFKQQIVVGHHSSYSRRFYVVVLPMQSQCRAEDLEGSWQLAEGGGVRAVEAQSLRRQKRQSQELRQPRRGGRQHSRSRRRLHRSQLGAHGVQCSVKSMASVEDEGALEQKHELDQLQRITIKVWLPSFSFTGYTDMCPETPMPMNTRQRLGHARTPTHAVAKCKSHAPSAHTEFWLVASLLGTSSICFGCSGPGRHD